MYAVIKTGGKQYKVQKGDVVDVERLEGKEGAKLTFDEVLFLGGKEHKLGHPLVDGASVEGKIKEQFRGKKIIVYKKKRRKGYEKRQKKCKIKFPHIYILLQLQPSSQEKKINPHPGTFSGGIQRPFRQQAFYKLRCQDPGHQRRSRSLQE